MTGREDLLVEIGTEELPPKALRNLMDAFAANVRAGFDAERLAFQAIQPYASPRRLALLVRGLAEGQEDRESELRGPPVRVAFDRDGRPAPAALAFAQRCGVDVGALGRSATDKGEWLSHRLVEKGAATTELVPGIVSRALDALPIPRRMRWGDRNAEFVRPVHWVVLRYGGRTIEAEILDNRAGDITYGHRFMAPGGLRVRKPADYAELLESKGYVVADFDERRRRVVDAVAKAAGDAGGSALGSDALYDEVTALVEWPVPITGRFEEEFLALPREVIVATLTGHQRYFPVQASDGSLMPVFVTVANIASRDPDRVRDGNERVVRPRLADAAFFWDSDRRRTLADRRAILDTVVYQQGLGSMHDKSARTAALAGRIATALGADAAIAERAALLAKCDLVTGMVGEFPELQGIMGRYYAAADGENPELALAIEEQYLPRYAGDALPVSVAGQCLAIADKLDTLCGIFALGKKPSGNKDPFGLRRAALGIVRIVVERRLDLDMVQLVDLALGAQPVRADPAVGTEVYDFIIERMRAWSLERGGFSPEMFEAVRERRPASLADFEARLEAVAAFVSLDAASSLAQANKRIANILRQAAEAGGTAVAGVLDPDALAEPAEAGLFEALEAARAAVDPLLAGGSYAAALARLAELREPVDRFFDDVMVMAEDAAVRQNRLALLGKLRDQFLEVADISRLSIGKA
ncbi:MAG: glycine--tRNA ligase subunit beta [Gammaproteobacteria bacterium]|nr:glycine--tRNA ligase subunit beta [Gammaproteobacteria bacterium]MDH4254671.1 glycine--tRNA ligase subunit beta [Gammaproteobacteria bacterium]MDH5310031.1 glycine--tRNA ligase subunit beta [Gammaproteobacteria bacterium]